MGDQKFIKSANIVTVESQITREDRIMRNGHNGGVLWFTGLSGSGKSTLATELERRLFNAGYNVYVLDGDNVRHGLSSNLGFSPADRTENIRRIGEIAALFAHAGLIVITAFISPYREDRKTARIASGSDFHEIFIDADLSVCERRDPKGLYRKARQGEITEFTGISAPYEAPEAPEFTVDTGALNVAQSVAALTEYVTNAFEQRKE
jgi:bifunctional enzyme CysN/CysC